MLSRAENSETETSIRTNLRAIFVSLELSRTTWLVTSLSPGTREKMSKHSAPAGDIGGLLVRLRSLQERVRARRKQLPPLVVIQEAGLEGFWIHRVLTENGIESHVVDPASVATSRRRRRAKTDKLDGDTLVRTLLAYKRGEPRVCAMVRRRCAAYVHEGGVGGPSQKPVQFVEFAAFALPADPAPLALVPNSPTVQPKEARARGRGTIASIEAFNAVARDSDQFRIAFRSIDIRVDPIR